MAITSISAAKVAIKVSKFVKSYHLLRTPQMEAIPSKA